MGVYVRGWTAAALLLGFGVVRWRKAERRSAGTIRRPRKQTLEINFGFMGERNPAAGAYQVPDFDINYGLGDRIQLKYDIPIAIEETRPQPVTPGAAAAGQTIGGLGESLLGIKWRFYGHHSGDAMPILR